MITAQISSRIPEGTESVGSSALQSVIFPRNLTLHSFVSALSTANPSFVLSSISSGFAKRVNLSLYGALEYGQKSSAVAAFVAHIIYMDHLSHFHSRYFNGNICPVRTYVHAVFADLAAGKASLAFFFCVFFFFRIPFFS